MGARTVGALMWSGMTSADSSVRAVYADLERHGLNVEADLGLFVRRAPDDLLGDVVNRDHIADDDRALLVLIRDHRPGAIWNKKFWPRFSRPCRVGRQLDRASMLAKL